MLTSYELRWFYPGTIPEEVELWFEQNCLSEPEAPPEEREDVYLYSPQSDFLGIKLRQGRLEVKWRTAELGVISFGDFVEGKAEKWGKWMCEEPTGESFQPATVLGNASWVSVQKVRYLQQYQVLLDSPAKPRTNSEGIHNGCSAELTHLLIGENAWWSLAFEAFGEEAYLMDNLQTVAASVFKTYRGSKLLAADSYAYPKWLAVVV